MHTEHLQNVKPARVVTAWSVAAAATSLVVLVLINAGFLTQDATAANNFWSVIAVAAGFFAGGLFVGFRAIEAPILHAFAMGLTTLIIWFALNALAAAFLDGWTWSGLTPQLTIGILFTQWAASTVGALLGHNIALRGRPGLAEQDPV